MPAKSIHLLVIVGISVLFPFSCNDDNRASGVMLNFDFARREIKTVHPQLQEISGIHYLNDGQKIAAVNDEDGIIFILDFSGKQQSRLQKFGRQGDYEDITADSYYYYILQSRGRILRVPKTGVPDSVDYFELPSGDNDFESMYMDAARNRLVLICKSCRKAEKDKMIPAFCFDLASMQFQQQPCFMMDTRKVRMLLNEKNLECRPSAAAIHPVLNKLFVLCSVGKVLVICDTEGRVEEAFRLDPAFFPQPEGITFAPNGDMFISNEGQDQLGTIIRFPFVAP